MRAARFAITLVGGLVLGATLLARPDEAAAQARPPALFTTPTAHADARPVAANRHARRARTLQARVSALDAPTGAGRAVLLNLFDDATFTARRTMLERRGPNNYTWHGRLDGDRDGLATLVVNGGVVMGTVFAHGHTFEIASTGNGLHEIRELDPASFPTDDPPLLEADVPPASDQPESGAAAFDTTAQIDVLVVWTPAARAAVGSTTAMQNLVTLAVANANTAYANSQIAAQLRLVYSGEVAFAETPANISGDLNKLSTSGDGALDTVQTLRNQYGADVVSLIGTGYTSGSGACGIGYLMTTVSTTFASAAFNVVDQACAAGNLSLAHEIGHNEGLHHDPANASGQGAYPYAFGYQDPGGLFRTVMSVRNVHADSVLLESQRPVQRQTDRRGQHAGQRTCAQQHGVNGREFPDGHRAHVQLHGHTTLAATRGRGWILDGDRHHGRRLCMDSHESRWLDYDGHRDRHRNGLVHRQRRRQRTVRAVGTVDRGRTYGHGVSSRTCLQLYGHRTDYARRRRWRQRRRHG